MTLRLNGPVFLRWWLNNGAYAVYPDPVGPIADRYQEYHTTYMAGDEERPWVNPKVWVFTDDADVVLRSGSIMDWATFQTMCQDLGIRLEQGFCSVPVGNDQDLIRTDPLPAPKELAAMVA